MKKLHKLTDRTIRATSAGKYHDGAGLYLIVSPGTDGVNRRWQFRYGIGNGKHRYLGLGAYPLVGLADARKRAQDARELLAKGSTPLHTKPLYGLP